MRLLHQLAAAALVVAAALPSRAETQGPYVHGTLRQDDGQLIVCHDEEIAVTAAQAVNAAFLDILEEALAAPDDEARQAIYDTKLYPTIGWQTLMGAIYTHRCDLVEVIDHTSRRTVYVGPEELVPLGGRHSVVESELYDAANQGAFTGFVVTTEDVPPVE